MTQFIMILLSIFLFTAPIFGQVAAIKGASAEIQIPAGGLEMVYDLTFSHTAIAVTSSSGTVYNATFSQPIDIRFRGYQSAIIEIYSATMTAGSIGGASYAAIITARDDIVSPTEVEASLMIPVKTASADTLAWAAIPYMTTYGRHEIPLAGGNKLYLWAGGVDKVSRKVKVTLR